MRRTFGREFERAVRRPCCRGCNRGRVLLAERGGRARPQDLLGREGYPAGDEGGGPDGDAGDEARGIRGRGAGGDAGREPGARHGSVPSQGVQPRARRDHPGHERQPGLHRRQAAGSGRLRLGVCQGPDRRHHAVSADDPVRAIERSADRGGIEGSRGRCGPDIVARCRSLHCWKGWRMSRVADSPGRSLSVAGFRRGPGGDDTDRHAGGRVGVFGRGRFRFWASGCGRWGWHRWPAGPRRSGSSARKETGRSCRDLRCRSRW